MTPNNGAPCSTRAGDGDVDSPGRPSSGRLQRDTERNEGQGRTGATRRPSRAEDCEDRTLTGESTVASARYVGTALVMTSGPGYGHRRYGGDGWRA